MWGQTKCDISVVQWTHRDFNGAIWASQEKPQEGVHVSPFLKAVSQRLPIEHAVYSYSSNIQCLQLYRPALQKGKALCFDSIELCLDVNINYWNERVLRVLHFLCLQANSQTSLSLLATEWQGVLTMASCKALPLLLCWHPAALVGREASSHGLSNLFL